MACLFSIGHDVPATLVKYFLMVQVYSILIGIVDTTLLYVDNYYYQLSILDSLDAVRIGQLYKERIIAEQLVNNVDYAFRVNNYLFGLVQIKKILSRDHAIKANWILEKEKYNVELNPVGSSNDGNSFILQSNPLHVYQGR